MCVFLKFSFLLWFIIGLPSGSDGKESACNTGDPGSIPGWEDPLGKGIATHSSTLAWRIPQTKETSGPHSTPRGHKESDMD